LPSFPQVVRVVECRASSSDFVAPARENEIAYDRRWLAWPNMKRDFSNNSHAGQNTDRQIPVDQLADLNRCQIAV
jgi:hypothetical protein